MNPIDQAIANLNAAINELEKRLAAKELGVAIGNALGTSSGLWRSEVQIDAMSLAEIEAWGQTVEASVSEPGSDEN